MCVRERERGDGRYISREKEGRNETRLELNYLRSGLWHNLPYTCCAFLFDLNVYLPGEIDA